MLAEKVVVVNSEKKTAGADAIMWTPPICQEENDDCLFAYVAPKPKRCAPPVVEGPSDELAFMADVLKSLRLVNGTPAECKLADGWLNR